MNRVPELPLRVRPHLPVRPVWLCRDCLVPWPCSAARMLLRCEYEQDRRTLAVCLTGVLCAAAVDQHALGAPLTPDEAYRRFLAWAGPRYLVT